MRKKIWFWYVLFDCTNVCRCAENGWREGCMDGWMTGDKNEKETMPSDSHGATTLVACWWLQEQQKTETPVEGDNVAPCKTQTGSIKQMLKLCFALFLPSIPAFLEIFFFFFSRLTGRVDYILRINNFKIRGSVTVRVTVQKTEESVRIVGTFWLI